LSRSVARRLTIEVEVADEPMSGPANVQKRGLEGEQDAWAFLSFGKTDMVSELKKGGSGRGLEVGRGGEGVHDDLARS
jgi:hypothetical protein